MSSDGHELEEQAPFLEDEDHETTPTHPVHVSPLITRRLYVSHFLSTWNSRVFEFGAVLYLAAIYPNTLLPMSVYAFARGLAAVMFSPAVGQYIDTGDRLRVVRNSILVQRVAVALSCVIFYLLCRGLFTTSVAQNGTLALLALLACFEKLCSIMNFVAVVIVTFMSTLYSRANDCITGEGLGELDPE